MIRALVLAGLLAGCATATPPRFPTCPPRLPEPARAPKNPTADQVAKLEIRVELDREAERARGDACAAAVQARDMWIRKHP